MRKWVLLTAAVLAAALQVAGQESPDVTNVEPAGVRFGSVEVRVDAGATPLAAYQLEFVADPERVKIVGIEGGEHPAFLVPPYYDPAALMHHRVILAAFSTAEELPVGPTRVTTLHLRIVGEEEPDYSAELTVAADAAGNRIEATVDLQ
jgi:hypothetical protein